MFNYTRKRLELCYTGFNIQEKCVALGIRLLQFECFVDEFSVLKATQFFLMINDFYYVWLI